jgi:hypothetical protein
VYDALFVEDGLRTDILVNDEMIIELKAQGNDHPALGSAAVELFEVK